jgi:hypothetical protein
MATSPATATTEAADSRPTRAPQPIILIRGFGGLGVEDEKRIAYQGFNDGTVYPHKRGENYIYEGLVLRFMKSDWEYQDATNVVGYFGSPIKTAPREVPELKALANGLGAAEIGSLALQHAVGLSLLRSQ